MAIPFRLPCEDDNNRSEIELAQLLGELIDINHQIQILLRARMLSSNSTTSTRVPIRQRNHQHQQNSPAQPSSILPDLVSSNLPSSTPAVELRSDGALSSRHNNINSDNEASCCYHAKFTTHVLAQDNDTTTLPLMTATADVEFDWKQVGVIVRRVADIFKTAERLSFMSPTSICSSPSTSPPSCLMDDDTGAEDKSLFSKIIPATTSSRSLWTAVICVVGWHIFRAR